MNAKDKIEKAKINLVFSNPFFASLALGIEYIEDNSIKTANTNGSAIRYNPAFIDTLSVDLTKTLIAHECLHTGLLHHIRTGKKDHSMWNQAADYAINQFLVDEGFKLPEGGLLNPKYRNMTAESIYTIIEKQKQKEDKNKSEQGQQGDQKQQGQGQGQGQPKPEEFGEFSAPDTNVSEEEANQKQKMVQASELAQQGSGKISANLLKQIGELIQPKIDWRETLQRFVSEIAHNDYNWTKPSKRYMAQGLYLPSLENLEVGNVIFVIDTSGSINKKMLATFVSELKEAMESFEFPVTVIHADNRVQHVEKIDIDSKIVPIGGGGTNFNPAFKHIEENFSDSKAVIYFTDGDCRRYPESFDIPTIWAEYEDHNFNPPFGEKIRID